MSKQKIRLSHETLEVLKNFHGVNKSILIRPGRTLMTMSESKSVIGVAEVQEEFTSGFAIYDLGRFLSSLSLFSDPELEIGESQMTIHEGDRRLNYTFADPSTVLSIDDKAVAKLDKITDEAEVEFPWTNEVYQSVSKALSILKLPEFVVEGDGKAVSIRADDTRNPTGDTFQTKVSDDDKEFRAVFRAENIRFLPKDYHVTFSSRGVARFKGEGIKYLVMTESRK